MKKIIPLFLSVYLILFIFSSCTKEEVGKDAPQNEEVGVLSFGSLLNNFKFQGSGLKMSQEGSYNIPQCSDEAPLYVFVSIKVYNNNNEWEWYKNSNEDKIKIEVNPNGADLNGDGDPDAWFTRESADLELIPGKYRIEYLAVTGGEDPADIIFMAPRVPNENIGYTEDIQYHNFVKKPLPIEVTIHPGQKYYQPVEVLCYEEHFAFAFGYLYFDFNNPELIYLCTFGNVCDENEKHIPAQFKIKIWKDASKEELLVVAQNERKSFSDQAGTHYYADALCFPLPVLNGNDEYYAKIWLVEDDTENLIREGSFGSGDLAGIYQPEQEHYYYHFREACCGEADNYILLEDLTENEEECEEEPQDPECYPCEGKISKLTFYYAGEDNTPIIVEQNTNGNNPIEIFNQILDNGQTFSIEGKFSKDGQPNSLWTEIYIKEGDNEIIQIHTSCSDPDVVPGYTVGNFEILSGESAKGGGLCPAPN